MSQAIFQFSSSTVSLPMDTIKSPAKSFTIFGSQLKSREIEQTHLRFLDCFKRTPTFRLEAVRESPGLTQEIIDNPQKSIGSIEKGSDAFKEMRHRFLSFKKDKYLENLEHYQTLAKGQAPKFMVIACADSRVCPSSILGFQPGEAFVVRNVANLVPPHENGPTETNAALEFAVNSLEVENILVVGHSCCGGIHALMSMQDEINSSSSSFIKSWVVVGKAARLRTKAAVSDLNLDQQCRHCEKESINRSLLNLLTYPWIENQVKKGILSLHGGYYDFVDCTFEKWTLDCKGCWPKVDGEYSIKNREFWRTPTFRLEAVRESPGLTQEIIDNPQKSIGSIEKGSDAFKEMRHRFLSFKKDKYLENLEHYQTLAKGQAPKFMVIACADSRVCPSSILGFQPGEAFVVRNVANLVPPHENGPTETNAALEFAVNSLEVENILVVGHSCCGGIHALMSMQDEINSSSSSFIKSWVVVGKAARLRTKAAVSDLNLDQQCRHCEKESINRSLLNLLTYPWIENQVKKGILSLHGGYYDFVDCTFEKWTLDCKGCWPKVDGEYSIKNREFWS